MDQVIEQLIAIADAQGWNGEGAAARRALSAMIECGQLQSSQIGRINRWLMVGSEGALDPVWTR